MLYRNRRRTKRKEVDVWATLKINGRNYDVSYTEDTLIPENVRYVDGVEAIAYTPKGSVFVTSARILNKIVEKLEN